MSNFSKQRVFGWLLFLSIFIATLLWVWQHPEQRAASRIYQNMMASTTAALQESIIFAHLRYHNNAIVGQVKLDLIEIEGQGLDFNNHGFPVGVDHSQDSVQLPINSSDCRDIWNTLLIQLRPLLAPADNAMLTVKAVSGECVFTSVKYTNQRIIYNPKSGMVRLQITN